MFKDSKLYIQFRAIAMQRKGIMPLLGLAIVFSMLMLLVSVIPASAEKPVSKFVGDGDTASAFTTSPTGQIFIQVTRGGSLQKPETFLFYSVVQFYPPVFISQLGEGVIPNSDFKVMGQKLVLNTDTSVIPGFTHTLCTPDESTCGPGTGGVINVEWNRTADFSNRFTGISEFIFGNIVMRSVGTTRDSSASAQGTALGTPFQTTLAFTGTNHQVNLTIERGN
jgi:hypothetical protein